MQQRTLKIIVVFAFFLQSVDSAGQNEVFTPHYYPFIYLKGIYSDQRYPKAPLPPPGKFIPVVNRPISTSFEGPGRVFTLASMRSILWDQRLPAYSIEPNYYSVNTGFFCRTEWQFEKNTTIPLRFRVGMIDYVNYLEQKPNAVQPRQ